jgi:hypothetical protein
MSVSYLSPKAHPVAVGAAGRGSVADRGTIAAGDVVAAFGGRCLTRVEFDLLPASPAGAQHPDRGCAVPGRLPPSRSRPISSTTRANPTCGMRGATRCSSPCATIAVGEAITYDYATSDGSDYDEFECACGSHAVPWQGHRLRLDAARSAAAASRVSSARISRHASRRWPASAPSVARSPTDVRRSWVTCDPPQSRELWSAHASYWSSAPAVWVRRSCRSRHDGRCSSRSPWPTSTSPAPRGPQHG